jgi:hypothetical protein
MAVGDAGWRDNGGAFVFSRRGETVVVNIGIWAIAVCVGKELIEGATEEMGVLGCGNNTEILSYLPQILRKVRISDPKTVPQSAQRWLSGSAI